MAMYALALSPLTELIRDKCKQVWYADDATGCDTFEKLLIWFNELKDKGPSYGYFPKPEKCILLTKPDRVERAREVFLGSRVKVETEGSKDAEKVKKNELEINSQGTRHLGAALGTLDFKHLYVMRKVRSWVYSVQQLALIAATQPHAAFAAFTHCLQSQWTFVSRAMTDISDLFQPLEDAIRLALLPALVHREVNDLERELLSMPARYGGLGMTNPTQSCTAANVNSLCVTEPLVDLIMSQSRVRSQKRDKKKRKKQKKIDIHRYISI